MTENQTNTHLIAALREAFEPMLLEATAPLLRRIADLSSDLAAQHDELTRLAQRCTRQEELRLYDRRLSELSALQAATSRSVERVGTVAADLRQRIDGLRAASGVADPADIFEHETAQRWFRDTLALALDPTLVDENLHPDTAAFREFVRVALRGHVQRGSGAALQQLIEYPTAADADARGALVELIDERVGDVLPGEVYSSEEVDRVVERALDELRDELSRAEITIRL